MLDGKGKAQFYIPEFPIDILGNIPTISVLAGCSGQRLSTLFPFIFKRSYFCDYDSGVTLESCFWLCLIQSLHW